MKKVLGLILALGLCFCLSLAFFSTGSLSFLWLFPLAAKGFVGWFLIASLDLVFLFTLPVKIARILRAVFWMSIILLYCVNQHAIFLGLAVVLLPLFLWWSSHFFRPFLGIGLGLLLCLLLWGHMDHLTSPADIERLSEFRFSVHLLAMFLLFRLGSWLVMALFREQKPDLFLTLTYFLHPVYLLFPAHANFLIWSRWSEAKPNLNRKAIFWIVRGLFHGVFFTYISIFIIPWLAFKYDSGFSHIHFSDFIQAGVFTFTLAYLEKSRVTFMVAGFLSLGGQEIEPDFHAPWLARGLMDYWRRFHYWVMEFYLDVFYTPLSVYLSRFLSARATTWLSIFLTFSLGTVLSHYVAYPGKFGITLLLGIIFGFSTLLHYFCGKLVDRWWFGIPFTWITVFFLYVLAYPVFGLGWDLNHLRNFFNR